MQQAFDNIADRAIAYALGNGCDFCDVRLQNVSLLKTTYRSGKLAHRKLSSEGGFCFRIVKNGALGHFSIMKNQIDSPKTAIDRCIDMAKRSRVRFDPRLMNSSLSNVRDSFSTGSMLDDLNDEDKQKRVCEASGLLFQDKSVDLYIQAQETRSQSFYMSSESVELAGNTNHLIFAVLVISDCGGNFANESFWATKGYEDTSNMAFLNLIGELRKEVVGTAKEVTEGEHDIIFSPCAAAIFLHETIGHFTEADFVIRSSMKLSNKKICQEYVTVYDTAGEKGSHWYVPYDDEGLKKEKTALVDKGILSNLIHSRETAAYMSASPTGNGRAPDFRSVPFPAQITLTLLPGVQKQADLINDTRQGILVKCTYMSRTHERGALVKASRAYEIQDGQITNSLRPFDIPVKDALQALGKIDAVASDSSLSTTLCFKYNKRLIVGYDVPSIKVSKLLLKASKPRSLSDIVKLQ